MQVDYISYWCDFISYSWSIIQVECLWYFSLRSEPVTPISQCFWQK
jgi:hypothetical protein